MERNEVRSLHSQIKEVYDVNRWMWEPFNIHLCGYDPHNPVMNAVVSRLGEYWLLDANLRESTAPSRFVIPGIYIYKEIILQFFIFPTKNCVLNTGKPARKKFSSNFFVSVLLFTTLLMAKIGEKMANLCKSFTRKTTRNSIVGHSLSRSFAKSIFFEYLTQKWPWLRLLVKSKGWKWRLPRHNKKALLSKSAL